MLMKNIIAIMLAVFFPFAIVTTSFAELQWPGLEKAYKFLQITGEVKAVDKENTTITVSKKMKDKTIIAVAAIDDKTKIMMDKQNKSFNDIKAGDNVIVKYAEVNGKNIAKGVVIEPSVSETGE